ncbi:MAG: zinc ABC transporter substrate-binding protein [Victivallaceae bacterium]
MKKSIFWVFCLLVLGIVVLTGCSCRNSQNPSLKTEPESHKFTVLSTTRMIHDGVQRIGGDAVHSVVLMDGAIDPHSYELVKGDGDKIGQADLVFANGLGLEHSLSLQKALKTDPRTVFLGDLLFERHPNWFISDDGVLDPHIWLDLCLWAETIDDIVRSLSEKLPLHAKEFDKRGRELKNEMLALVFYSKIFSP